MNKFINNSEIQGIVGNIKETEFSEKYIYDISVCTESRYTSGGNWVVDIVWHQIKYWSDVKLNIEKGNWIHIKGHTKLNKYVDASGNNRSFSYVYATELEILPNEKHDNA